MLLFGSPSLPLRDVFAAAMSALGRVAAPSLMAALLVTLALLSGFQAISAQGNSILPSAVFDNPILEQ